ncbi:hypothetical protein ABZV65_04350 [Streptomyces bauhiniae]|uniref:hypothetical protein n=1 Tax=Streptomyces bauhiniae TaxID=2340725 RepID=UPI0033AE892D
MSLPIPGTGGKRGRYSTRSRGVSGSSRIIPHRYPDEGDRGPNFRRQIRKREDALWRKEASERPMIYPVLIGLSDTPGMGPARAEFSKACWDADAEPEYVDATSYDGRADDVTVVPTIRVYDDADPYGDPLAEHRGAFTGTEVRALLERAVALAV